MIPMMSSVTTYVLGAFSPTSHRASRTNPLRVLPVYVCTCSTGDYYAPLFVMLHANV